MIIWPTCGLSPFPAKVVHESLNGPWTTLRTIQALVVTRKRPLDRNFKPCHVPNNSPLGRPWKHPKKNLGNHVSINLRPNPQTVGQDTLCVPNPQIEALEINSLDPRWRITRWTIIQSIVSFCRLLSQVSIVFYICVGPLNFHLVFVTFRLVNYLEPILIHHSHK